MKTTILKNNWQYIALALLAAGFVLASIWAITEHNRVTYLVSNSTTSNSHETDVATALEEHGITPINTDQASNSQLTSDHLTYLIEEEKLAHDVYEVLYTKWGVRVFNNIQSSETMHQGMVLAVMDSRGLTDPRSNDLGVFVNDDLQSLYDKLIAQGLVDKTEAYNVGVLVEETDIADLKEALAGLDPKDSDVKAVLETLLHGSENHLRAFNRQLSL